MPRSKKVAKSSGKWSYGWWLLGQAFCKLCLNEVQKKSKEAGTVLALELGVMEEERERCDQCGIKLGNWSGRKSRGGEKSGAGGVRGVGSGLQVDECSAVGEAVAGEQGAVEQGGDGGVEGGGGEHDEEEVTEALAG